jgi:AcrR family transcriptional regulator
VEDIAARAGFTRGAFYSNFADKEAVFFALMDERMEQRARDITALMARSSPETFLDDLRVWSDANRSVNAGARVRMFAEFRAYALRDDAVRLQLVERERAVRAGMARAIGAQFAALGLDPPASPDDLALIVHALDTYLPLEQALDPEIPAGFVLDALTLLFRAGVALASSTAQ